MNAVLVAVSLVALLVVVEAQSSLGQSAGPARSAEQLANKKDKRGLFGAVVGYDPFAPPTLPALAVAYAQPGVDVYGPHRGIGSFKTPLAVSYPANYAVPVAKVAYGPAPAYGALTDGLFSGLGAYAPFGAYGAHGYGSYGPALYGHYAAPGPHSAGLIAGPAGYKAYAY